MKRLGVYWIRLQKNKSSKPPRSRSLQWAVTEGDGDGDVNGHSICLRTLINQTIGLSADLHRTDYPEGVRQSSADSELRKSTDPEDPKRGGGLARRFFTQN